MSNEPDDVNKKKGLTKDWWNRSGAYALNDFVRIDVQEYLNDLKLYLFSPSFAFAKSDEVLNLIVSFLQFAFSCRFHVKVRLV